MHCYRCGRQLPPDSPHLRRRVKTGERSSVAFRSGKVSAASNSFGMRVVCLRCVKALDNERTKGEMVKHLAAVGLLFALISLLALLK